MHLAGPHRMAHLHRREARYITEGHGGGHGLHQPPGGKTGEIRPGDIICTPAGEWHRHRATPGHLMTHLPITEAVPSDQRPEANWGEHVTDEGHHQR
jgi:quercetin dioxygenase-like cupin family protein